MPYNPKSLENLQPTKITSKEQAQEMQKKGLAFRRMNKEKKDAAKASIAAMKELGNEAPTAMEALKGALVTAIALEDSEEVVRIASILAEFESPKLARQTVVTTDVPLEELSDEELKALYEEAGLCDSAKQ